MKNDPDLLVARAGKAQLFGYDRHFAVRLRDRTSPIVDPRDRAHHPSV
jgi:hypothetical protein